MRSVQGVDRWQLGSRGEEAEPIKRAVKEAIHAPGRKLDGSVTDWAGWVCVGGSGGVGEAALQSGRHAGGQSWASALALEVATTVAAAFWWRSGWRAGAGWATPATDREEITQSDALRHTPVEEPAEGRGNPPEKPPLSPDSFQVNVGAGRGFRRRFVTAPEPAVILLCWFLINKLRLNDTMHLAGQHSDSEVAEMLFVFLSRTPTDTDPSAGRCWVLDFCLFEGTIYFVWRNKQKTSHNYDKRQTANQPLCLEPNVFPKNVDQMWGFYEKQFLDDAKEKQNQSRDVLKIASRQVNHLLSSKSNQLLVNVNKTDRLMTLDYHQPDKRIPLQQYFADFVRLTIFYKCDMNNCDRNTRGWQLFEIFPICWVRLPSSGPKRNKQIQPIENPSGLQKKKKKLEGRLLIPEFYKYL